MSSLGHQFGQEFGKMILNLPRGIKPFELREAMWFEDMQTWLDQWERDLLSCEICREPVHIKSRTELEYVDGHGNPHTYRCCEACKGHAEALSQSSNQLREFLGLD